MALHFEGKVEQAEFQLVDPGTYAVVMKAEFKKTKGGDDFINCSFQIMKEYNNTWGGRLVFDGIYKEANTGEFHRKKIDAILSTIKNPKTDFEDYDELVQYINGIEMLIDVDIQKADDNVPNSKDRNFVKYLSYKPLEGVEKVEQKEAQATTQQDVVNDDTLPF